MNTSTTYIPSANTAAGNSVADVASTTNCWPYTSYYPYYINPPAESPVMVIPLANGKTFKVTGSLPATESELNCVLEALRNHMKLNNPA